MSEKNTASSGAVTATSGAEGKVETDQSQVETSGSTKPDSAFVEKLLKEKRNYASKAAELETQLKSMKDERLVEKEQYKQLAEQRLKTIQELEAKVQTDQALRDKARKLAAVKKHLAQMGLRPEHEELALNKLLDVEDLVIDPDTQAVLGAEEKAKVFRQNYGTLGIFGQKAPGVNQNAPAGSMTTPKSAKDMTKKELMEKLKGTFQ